MMQQLQKLQEQLVQAQEKLADELVPGQPVAEPSK
jgi:DNA-binding protein YbaB